jgi:hypothetical protein
MEIRSAQKTETVLNWASGLGGSIGGYILSRKLGALTIIPAIGASLCGTLWDIPALTFTGVGIAVGNGVNFLSKQPGSVKSISSSTSTQTTLPKQPIQLPPNIEKKEEPSPMDIPLAKKPKANTTNLSGLSGRISMPFNPAFPTSSEYSSIDQELEDDEADFKNNY